jgi:hypothetical protein
MRIRSSSVIWPRFLTASVISSSEWSSQSREEDSRASDAIQIHGGYGYLADFRGHQRHPTNADRARDRPRIVGTGRAAARCRE